MCQQERYFAFNGLRTKNSNARTLLHSLLFSIIGLLPDWTLLSLCFFLFVD